MKKVLSFLLVMAIFASAIIAIVPPIEAEAAHSVVMTSNEFIGYLQYVVDRGDSRYGSGDEKSIGKYDGKYIYFDCWGLGESIICTKGKIVYNKNTSLNPWNLWNTSCGCGSKTGDWIKSQSKLSTDFTNIVPGEWLFKDNANGSCYHVGYYIGNGKVIESTTDGSYNTQITTIDSSGRSNIRGSSWKWTSHGKVPWISYHTCTDFTGLGVCTDPDCGKAFDWEKNFNSASAGKYTVVKAFTPRTDAPYDAATKASTTIKQGSTVNVEGTYTNAFNNTWYKFTYDSGKVGYVLDEYLELSGLNDLSVTCTGFTPAENASLPLGKGCHVWGTVKSNYPLKNVVAKLDGSQYATWTAANNTTTSFDINPTDINYSLKFGSLSAGKYTVTLIATDIHGRTQTFLTRNFYMGSAPSGNTSIEASDVFLKQETAVTCTLSAATMMVRRTAILKGLDDWKSITESSMRKIAWLEGAGLYHNFTYTHKGVAIKVTTNTNFSGDYATKKAKLIELLQKYPQGVEIYNTSQPHAILLTKYDAATDTFYCADSSGYAPKGQITLSQSSLKGSGQEGKINGVSMYWYVSSPTVTNVCNHSYTNECDSSCNNCGQTRTTTHTYTNDCDPSCDVCGETRAISHDYKYKYEVLDDHSSPTHWQECSSCGDKKNEEAHTFKPILSTSDEPLGNSNGHYMGCQICDWWERQPHIYDNDCDMSCNVCNYTDSERVPNHSFSTDYSSDESGHWYTCMNCGERDAVSAHIYTNDCDSRCNVCDYQREAGHSYGEEYMILSNGHIDVCSICGYSGALVDHVPGAAATETSPQTCIQCGYEICPAIEHSHKYDDGRIIKQPTCTEKGESIFTCIDCGETLTVEVAATGHIGTSQCEICGEIIATDSDSTTPGNGNDKGGEIIRIGCESAVAGTSMSIVAMIGICVGILKKKKRQ